MTGFFKFFVIFGVISGLLIATSAFKCRSADPWPPMLDSTCPIGFFLLDSGFCCPLSCKSDVIGPAVDGLCPLGHFLVIGVPGIQACCPTSDGYKEDVSV